MKNNKQAFSLIELLVVIAILALLATFLGPVARSITMGNSTTQASQIITGQIAIAKQSATTRNNPVELRFFKFADTDRPGETAGDTSSWKIRGVQLFEIKPDGSEVAISRLQKLPSTAIIDSSTTYSSIANIKEEPAVVSLPKLGTNYKYYPIRFRPSGGTTLNPNPVWKSWFLTIHDLQYGDNISSLPSNFVTIQIDPIQGSSTIFRPGLRSN